MITRAINRIKGSLRVAQRTKSWARPQWNEAYPRYRTAQMRPQNPDYCENSAIRAFARARPRKNYESTLMTDGVI